MIKRLSLLTLVCDERSSGGTKLKSTGPMHSVGKQSEEYHISLSKESDTSICKNSLQYLKNLPMRRSKEVLKRVCIGS